jgi:hypothetical protein
MQTCFNQEWGRGNVDFWYGLGNFKLSRELTVLTSTVEVVDFWIFKFPTTEFGLLRPK